MLLSEDKITEIYCLADDFCKTLLMTMISKY